jgi:Ca2+-binding RTX toxin-like protein
MNLWIARGTIIENAFGGSASDTLTGNEFANVLDGGLGNDTLIGGGGNDTLVGGGGNDIYYVDSAADTVVETAGGGTDAVRAHSHYRLDDFVENLVLTGGAALKGHGNTLANTLTGNSGGNKLYGLAGSDTISGGAGKDVITGGAGKDIIIGGFGSDRLTGGAGADRFVFGLGDTAASKARADTIFDMQGAKGDRIDLRAIDANESRGGNQKFDFIHTDKFSGHAGELRYEKARSDTYIYADTDGDRKIDFVLYLDDAINLKADYFML